MVIYHETCIILIVACGGVIVANSEPSLDSGHSNSIRSRRSMKEILTGLSALKKILTGAERVRTESPVFRKFEKIGNVDDAYRDFYSVNPQQVSHSWTRSTLRLHGVVGNKIIRLMDPKTKKSLDPSIDIVDPSINRNIKQSDLKDPLPYDYKVVYKTKKTKRVRTRKQG